MEGASSLIIINNIAYTWEYWSVTVALQSSKQEIESCQQTSAL